MILSVNDNMVCRYKINEKVGEMTDELVKAVWEKGAIVDDFDEDLIRKDACGAWIVFEEYGNRESDFGWEVDHVYPRSRGGDDIIDNLRPLNWRNNESKGNDFPEYQCAVCAQNENNVEISRTLIVNEKLRHKLERLYK